MGSGKKIPSPSETKNISIARKSIVASKKLKKVKFFSATNLTTKRPGTGLSPMLWNTIIGKKDKKNFVKDQLIKL